MGLDQKGDVVFRVSRVENGEWNVNEAGCDKPLASFDCEEDACNYANDLAGIRKGSRVVVEGRRLIGRLSLPRRARGPEAVQNKEALQTWEGEGGNPVRTAPVKPPA